MRLTLIAQNLNKCRWCGKDMIPDGTTKAFCSPECKRLRKNEYNRQRYHLKPGLKKRIIKNSKAWKKKNRQYYNAYINNYQKKRRREKHASSDT